MDNKRPETTPLTPTAADVWLTAARRLQETFNMSADIVERLNAWLCQTPCDTPTECECDMPRDAAAEIARLRAEVEALKQDREGDRDEIARLHVEVEALRRWCPRGEVRSASSDDGALGLGERGG